MNEDLKAELESALVGGGMSPESSDVLSDLLALHYPEHARVLLDYQP